MADPFQHSVMHHCSSLFLFISYEENGGLRIWPQMISFLTKSGKRWLHKFFAKLCHLHSWLSWLSSGRRLRSGGSTTWRTRASSSERFLAKPEVTSSAETRRIARYQWCREECSSKQPPDPLHGSPCQRRNPEQKMLITTNSKLSNT